MVRIIGVVAVARETSENAMAFRLSIVEADLLKLVGMLVCYIDWIFWLHRWSVYLDCLWCLCVAEELDLVIEGCVEIDWLEGRRIWRTSNDWRGRPDGEASIIGERAEMS
jgi:hypothetical protein